MQTVRRSFAFLSFVVAGMVASMSASAQSVSTCVTGNSLIIGTYGFVLNAGALFSGVTTNPPGTTGAATFQALAANPPGRTLTRPQQKVLEDGDIIVNELESSIIGYRAQQVRPVAVRSCDPLYVQLLDFHRELYTPLLDFIRPGVTLADIMAETRSLGAELCPRTGPLAGGGARFVCHGRGLGDDFPLATSDSALKQFGDWRFPENGVFIIKPNVFAGDGAGIAWGDTCRVTAGGTVRMGSGPHEMIIAGA